PPGAKGASMGSTTDGRREAMKAGMVAIGIGLALVTGCGGSEGDATESGTGAATVNNGASSSQKKIDDQCFVSYSQAAGRCNKSAGADKAAFEKCLTPVKAALVACCKSGGSPSCADDASGSSATSGGATL